MLDTFNNVKVTFGLANVEIVTWFMLRLSGGFQFI